MFNAEGKAVIISTAHFALDAFGYVLSVAGNNGPAMNRARTMS
jgi:hypothetical protein